MSAAQNSPEILNQNIMQRGPLSAVASDTVQTTLDILLSSHISALPIVDDDGLLMGIVTLRDLLAIASTRGSDQVTVAMTEAPVTVKLNHPLRESARLMLEHQVHHLPVVSDDGRLVGVISTTDFVRLFADGFTI